MIIICVQAHINRRSGFQSEMRKRNYTDLNDIIYNRKNMKVRIMKKKQQSSKMIYKNVPRNQQQSEELEQKINEDNNNQTFIILGTVFIILLALSLYIYAVVSLNNSSTNSDSHHRLNVSRKQMNLRDISMEDINSQNKIIINSPTDATKTSGGPLKLNLEYVQSFKKLSTQITLNKLNRSKQFLRNFTGPIDQNLYIEEKQQFQRNYQIFQYEQKPICVVVPTFNNIEQERYKKNIDSILQQQYSNYKVIIIDDASTDNTAENLEQYLRSNPIYETGKIRIQKNLQRKMALPNILDASSNFCQPEDIFIIIDGDDYLLGKYVFKLFNAAFSSSDSWVVYSNFLTVQGKIGYSRRYPAEIIQKNYFRNVLFVISHLRAYYTKLIHLIKKQDLLDEKGQYFHAANDVAILMPILQMSRQHIKYIPQINYYYNSNTGHNNHEQKKKQQVRNDKYIRMKPKYEKINQLFTK